MTDNVKITFGIIVLNGEPFTRYCIRALYPHAHQIIVAEGACAGAKGIATPDGHSRDGTLEILRQIKQTEDPENKITIVTAEDEGRPDGFWPGEKHEQSRAYARRATGNYLWQVDIDEFYKDEDIISIKEMLAADPAITAMSFKQLQFWGGFEYLVDGWYLRRGAEEFHRLFKWGKGYRYSTHRPPTVLTDKGLDTRAIKWVRATFLGRKNIYLFHYSYVFYKQVSEKADYYKNAEWAQLKAASYWANDIFLKLADPLRVFINQRHPSWLKRFKGEHPIMIQNMINDIKNHKIKIVIRDTADIEKLLACRWYGIKKRYYKMVDPVEMHALIYWKSLKRKVKKLLARDNT